MNGLSDEASSGSTALHVRSRPGAAPRAMADLLPRIGSSIVLVGVALGSVRSGGIWFDLFWLLAAAAILFEWQRLIGETLAGIGVGAVGLVLVLLSLHGGKPYWALASLAGAALAAGALARAGRRLLSFSGVACAAAMLMAVSVLRGSERLGPQAVVWLFAVVWANDIMAYFGGRLIGGPKLWPRVSPSKTWAGSIVGMLCGALAGTAWALAAVPGAAASIAFGFCLALLCAAATQVGDLIESSLKRRFGVKDSGNLIPGHGGVLDRLDGFVLASVLATLVGVGRDGLGSAAAGLFYW